MIFTKDEIQSQYRDAKKKKEQITILAQMNCCSEEEMKEYLVNECGIALQGRPVKKKDNQSEKNDIKVDIPQVENLINVLTPDKIKVKAFGEMVEMFNNDATKDYLEGFMYGVSVVLGMM